MSIAITNIKNETVSEVKVKSLYEKFGKKLFYYTRKNYQISQDDSWSLVYKTIYKVAGLDDSYTFQTDQKLSAFLFKTHINYLRNFFRDDKTFENKNHETQLHENTFVAEEDIVQENSPALSLLQTELDNLEEWERILLLMRGQGMPYGQIAKFVSKPEKQLKVYYGRLKKELLNRMNQKLNKSNPQNEK